MMLMSTLTKISRLKTPFGCQESKGKEKKRKFQFLLIKLACNAIHMHGYT